jgi:hypothetical protein
LPSKNNDINVLLKIQYINIYGTRYLRRSTTPRRIAGNKDVPDMTMIIIIMFMKISSTNKVTPLFLEKVFKEKISYALIYCTVYYQTESPF